MKNILILAALTFVGPVFAHADGCEESAVTTALGAIESLAPSGKATSAAPVSKPQTIESDNYQTTYSLWGEMGDKTYYSVVTLRNDNCIALGSYAYSRNIDQQ
jgi:hypothetical protein